MPSRYQPPPIPARPFGFRKTPFDPKTGKQFPLADARVVAAFTVEVVGANVLLGRDEHGKYTVVAKPWQFREQDYDGLTLNSVAYAVTATDARTATEGLLVTSQAVTPPYYVGEIILAAKRPVRVQVTLPDTTLYRAEWGDVNEAGRAWDSPGDLAKYDNAPTIGAASEGSETAATDTWDRENQVVGQFGLDEWYVSRVVYNHSGDEVLYKFMRMKTFDSLGRVITVSAETRVSIDVPETC